MNFLDLTLSPAYGRDYKSARETKDAFKAGKDFCTASGQYASIRDFPAGTEVRLRFKQQKQVTHFVTPGDKT